MSSTTTPPCFSPIKTCLRSIKAATLVLLLAALFSSNIAAAQGLSIAPRFSNGVLLYHFKLDNTFAVTGTRLGDFQESGIQGFDVNDDMYYAGGGISATYRRFFIDINGLITTEGSSNVSSQTYNINNLVVGSGIGSGVSRTQGGEANFDRSEITGLIGYDITDSLRIFTGFKYAEVTFDINANQSVDIQGSIGPNVARGFFSGKSNSKSTFVQKGPFIGVGYSVPVNILEGSVLINSAISYLYGDIHQRFRSQYEPGSVDFTGPGIPGGFSRVPFTPSPTSSRSSVDGTSVGINTGIGWSGRIPSTNMGYLIGADGSFYDFEADQSRSDFREISWRLRAEVSYRF